MARKEKILPILMPALAAGVRVVSSLLGEEAAECGGGGGSVGRAEVGDVREDGGIVVESANEDEDGSEDEDDDDGVEVAVIRSVEGMADNSCILLGSGLPPASPRAEIPHVFGSTLSLDVILKVGVLAKSSPEKLSTCM